jgi:hypothetical protein
MTTPDLPVEYVSIRFVMFTPLPLRVREAPELSRQAKVTLARMRLVELAANHYPQIAAMLRALQAPFSNALTAYTAAGDAAAQVLGHDHRRGLLATDDGALPTRHDRDEIYALAQLRPDLSEALAHATAALHVLLNRSRAQETVRESIESIPALLPTTPWLVPALIRRLHLRIYESLFGIVPAEHDVAAMGPGPRRPAGDRAPSGDRAHLRVVLVDFWFASRILKQPARQGAREWHEKMTDREHRRKYVGTDVDDCGCRKALKKGLKELDRLLAVLD